MLIATDRDRGRNGVLWVSPRIEEDDTWPLPKNCRQRVYNDGFSDGFLVGCIYGAVIVGVLFIAVTVAFRVREHTIIYPSPEDPAENGSRPTSPPSLRGESAKSQRVAPRIVDICATPHVRRRGGMCCISASEHIGHPENFRQDPGYQGKGRWVCGGEDRARAIRHENGTIDVSQCLWCEPESG